jgi:hypothetical protein
MVIYRVGSQPFKSLERPRQAQPHIQRLHTGREKNWLGDAESRRLDTEHRRTDCNATLGLCCNKMWAHSWHLPGEKTLGFRSVMTSMVYVYINSSLKGLFLYLLAIFGMARLFIEGVFFYVALSTTVYISYKVH